MQQSVTARPTLPPRCKGNPPARSRFRTVPGSPIEASRNPPLASGFLNENELRADREPTNCGRPLGKADPTMLASINAYGLIVAALVIALSIIAADKAAELRKSDPK